MPTPKKGPRLASSPAHERLMLANMATSLFQHGRITTTLPKAKRLRPLAERLITFAKRGDLHSRRRVMRVIRNKSVVHVLFTQIAEQMEQREGGYTRIVKIAPRKGDSTPAAIIELVTEPVSPKKAVVKEAEAATKVAAATEAPVEETAAAEAEAPAEEAAEAPVETVSLNVGYMPNYGSLWSVVTAIDKGYFAEENLEVTLTEFGDGPTIISAMESGSVNFGYIGQGAHKLCVQGNATIIALSHISNGDAVIGGPEVATIADLKGKTVAYSSGTSSEDILKNTLASAGMTMDDITAMDMDASAIVTAMISGGVDACATWSPNTLAILEQMENTTKLSDNMTFADTTISLASWIATPKYLEENRDVAVRFVRALFKAMDYAADGNYEEIAQLVADQTKTDYDSVYSQRGDANWLTGKAVAEGIADGTVEGYYSLQQQNLLASEAITQDDVCPVSDYVDLALMTEAGNY